MSRKIEIGHIVNPATLNEAGLSAEMIVEGVKGCYEILDAIDDKLLEKGLDRLADILEYAALSSVIGEVFAAGIANASNGAFKRNGPHKFPDLLAQNAGTKGIEFKVAMEKNKPKGHLPKPGRYITCRYVLGDENGNFTRGKENRGNVVWIWEVRIGDLRKEHFSFSSTEGDSGKTAPINAAGMKQMAVVYCDMKRCPYSPNGRTYKAFEKLYSGEYDGS